MLSCMLILCITITGCTKGADVGPSDTVTPTVEAQQTSVINKPVTSPTPTPFAGPLAGIMSKEDYPKVDRSNRGGSSSADYSYQDL
ncbi:MAG: hypothetical protein K0S47_3992 [Herbinix sp.]|nr:hypothetical protein [Herbinix sp.]